MTAWLKYHYPVEFFASVMNFVGKIDELPSIIADAKRHGIQILPPNINKSEANFTTENGNIRFGLAFLRGAKSRANDVIKAREGKFANFREFVDCEPGKAMAEACILSGACDGKGPDCRSSLMRAYEELVELKKKANAAIARYESFEDKTSAKALEAHHAMETAIEQYKNYTMPNEKPYTLMERLNYELHYTSVYLSGNPLDNYVITKDIVTIDSLDNGDSNGDKWIAGTLSETNVMKTKKGARQMMSGKITDSTGTINFIMFPQVYEQCSARIDNVMAFSGYLSQKDDEEPQFVVNEVKTLPEKKRRMTIWYKDFDKEMEIVRKGNVDSSQGFPVAFATRGKKMVKTEYHITREYADAHSLTYDISE